MIDLSGQVAIVTGAGRGLGRLYALELARRGAAVVVNDLGTSTAGAGTDRHVADEVVEEVRQAGGSAVASYESVETAEGAAAIVAAATDAFGRLDVVVSNAGIFTTAPFEDLTPEQWERMRSVHLDGGFFLTQSGFLTSIEPELVVPLVVWLASRECTSTHEVYSALAGRFARAFVGLGPGLAADRGARRTADDLAEHAEELRALEPFTVPGSIFDEIAQTCALLGITS